MEINVLLVDDDQTCIESLKTSLRSFSFINIVGEVNNAFDAICFLQKNGVDLIFLDIEMDETNGLELANHLKSTHPDILVIFVTGHPGFALKSFEVHPVDYLTKPINMLRLEKALEKVKEIKNPHTPKFDQKIGIKVSGGIRIVNVNDILFLEKRGRKVFIECDEGDSFDCSESMQTLEMIFSQYGFFRSHQSFLVAIDKIKAIYPDSFTRSYLIEMNHNEMKLPLSRNKYQELKDLLYSKGVHIY
nr:LytTR family DNA-binding domain-containing protein [Lederbergia citrisecunda]